MCRLREALPSEADEGNQADKKQKSRVPYNNYWSARNHERAAGESRDKSLHNGINTHHLKVAFGDQYEQSLNGPRNNGPIHGDMPHSNQYELASEPARKDARSRISVISQNGPSQGSSSSHGTQGLFQRLMMSPNVSSQGHPSNPPSVSTTQLSPSTSVNVNRTFNCYLIASNVSSSQGYISNPSSISTNQLSPPQSVGNNGLTNFGVVSPNGYHSQGYGSNPSSVFGPQMSPQSATTNGTPTLYLPSNNYQTQGYHSNPLSMSMKQMSPMNSVGPNGSMNMRLFSPNSFSSQDYVSNSPSISSPSNSSVKKKGCGLHIIPGLQDDDSPPGSLQSLEQILLNETPRPSQLGVFTQDDLLPWQGSNASRTSPAQLSDSSTSSDFFLRHFAPDIFWDLQSGDLKLSDYADDNLDVIGLCGIFDLNGGSVDLDADPEINVSVQPHLVSNDTTHMSDYTNAVNGSELRNILSGGELNGMPGCSNQLISNHQNQNLQPRSSNVNGMYNPNANQVVFNAVPPSTSQNNRPTVNGTMNPPATPRANQQQTQPRRRGRPPGNAAAVTHVLANRETVSANRMPNMPAAVIENPLPIAQGNAGAIAIAPNVRPRFTQEDEQKVKLFLAKNNIVLERNLMCFLQVLQIYLQQNNHVDGSFMAALAQVRMTSGEGCSYQYIANCLEARERSGCNSIHFSIIHRLADVLKLFLSFRPRVDYEAVVTLPENQERVNGHAITFAIYLRNPRMLEMLLEHLTKLDKDLLKQLLEKRIETFEEGRTVQYNALKLAFSRFRDTEEDKRIIKLLLTKQNLFSAIDCAAASPHAEQLMMLCLDELRQCNQPRMPQQTWSLPIGQTIIELLRTNLFVRYYNAPQPLADIIAANRNLNEDAKRRILTMLNNWH